MAFTVHTDDFARADASLDGITSPGGVTWDNINGDPHIESGLAGAGSSGGYVALAVDVAFASDSGNQYAQLKFDSVSPRAVICYSPESSLIGNSYQLANWDGSLYTILRADDDGAGTTSFTILDASAETPANGDIIKLAREGNDVVAYLDGVEMARATDTTYMTGRPGFANYYADDFESGVETGGTNTVTIRARVVAQTSKSGTASYGSTEV